MAAVFRKDEMAVAAGITEVRAMEEVKPDTITTTMEVEIIMLQATITTTTAMRERLGVDTLADTLRNASTTTITITVTGLSSTTTVIAVIAVVIAEVGFLMDGLNITITIILIIAMSGRATMEELSSKEMLMVKM